MGEKKENINNKHPMLRIFKFPYWSILILSIVWILASAHEILKTARIQYNMHEFEYICIILINKTSTHFTNAYELPNYHLNNESKMDFWQRKTRKKSTEPTGTQY